MSERELSILVGVFVVTHAVAKQIRRKYHVAIDRWIDRQIPRAKRLYRFLKSIVTFQVRDDRTEAERAIAGEVK